MLVHISFSGLFISILYLCADQLKSFFSCSRCIFCIGIRADAVRKFLCHRRTADHDLHLVTDAGFFCSLDHFTHDGHGCGQQSGKADDIGIFIDGGPRFFPISCRSP